mmetsp:Transcript_16115/g.50399  ORF Transcript_16115/g.50399 Transcript_16115/m.50399 type:complete len:264 (-) Transcript_16115:322-1113(-)
MAQPRRATKLTRAMRSYPRSSNPSTVAPPSSPPRRLDSFRLPSSSRSNETCANLGTVGGDDDGDSRGNSACSSRCFGREDSHSSPRRTSETSVARSSTTEARWYVGYPVDLSSTVSSMARSGTTRRPWTASWQTSTRSAALPRSARRSIHTEPASSADSPSTSSVPRSPSTAGSIETARILPYFSSSSKQARTDRRTMAGRLHGVGGRVEQRQRASESESVDAWRGRRGDRVGASESESAAKSASQVQVYARPSWTSAWAASA